VGRGRLWALGEIIGLGGLVTYVWLVHGRCLPELLSFHPWKSVATLFVYLSFATLVIELTAAFLVRVVEFGELVRDISTHRRQPAFRGAYRQIGEARQAIGAPRMWGGSL
jgi:hypothetical protein